MMEQMALRVFGFLTLVGILVMQVLGIFPLLSGIASLFGYGALMLLAWRTLRATPSSAAAAAGRPLPTVPVG